MDSVEIGATRDASRCDNRPIKSVSIVDMDVEIGKRSARLRVSTHHAAFR